MRKEYIHQILKNSKTICWSLKVLVDEEPAIPEEETSVVEDVEAIAEKQQKKLIISSEYNNPVFRRQDFLFLRI
jgi:hypothetical protein